MRYGREPLGEIERRNKGWLTAENCPPVDVFVDGVKVDHVMAVNRKRGKVTVAVLPIRANRRGEVLTQAIFGCVTVELKG
jgi:hypothetical protein